LLERGVELCFGSLADETSLSEACRSCDAVIHVAGVTKVREISEFYAVNQRGTALLASQAARRDCRRFIYLSSLAACGPSRTGRPLTEADPARPVSDYGRSKLAGELAVREHARGWVILRPPAVYGPFDRDIFPFFKLASFGVALRIGRAERTISMIYVKDLARSVVRALSAPPGSVYFVADPRPYGWKEIGKTFGKAVGRRVSFLPVPFSAVRTAAYLSDLSARFSGKPVIFNRDKLKELCFPCWTCSSGLFQCELGFTFRYDLKKGAAETALWYSAQGWL